MKYLYIFLLFLVFIVSYVRDLHFYENDKPYLYKSDFITDLQTRLEKCGKNLKNRELVLALSVGKRDFRPEFRNALALTGTMHLVAISAFHTGIMILVFGIVFKTLVFFMPFRPYVKRIIEFVLKIAASAYYFLITGASIPTLRSLVFMLLFDLFVISGTYPHSVLIFLFSLAVVSLAVPGSVSSLSFIMSALCVATVIKIWRILPRSAAVSIVCVSILVNWILLATASELSGVFPLSAPFVNFFVIPVVSVTVPFITVAQFLVPFSETAAAFALETADFIITPASFLISFFAGFAEKTAVPIVAAPVLVKIFFVVSFFTALYSTNKIKCFSAITNLCCALFFFFPFFSSDEFMRSAAFGGKAFCVKENFSSGRIFFDKYSKNPAFNNYFYSNIERFSAVCGMTEVLSVHTPQKVPEKQKAAMRKKIRFKNTKFYSRE